MGWQRSEAIEEAEASAVGHFLQTRFRRVKGDVIEALVVKGEFVDQTHRGCIAREDDAFAEKELTCHSVKVANREKGIFQVIEKAETEDKIEFSE